MKIKKIVSVLLALAMLMLAFTIHGSAKTLDDLQNDIDSAQQEIDKYKGQKAKQKEYIAALQKQIDAYEQQLTIISDELEILNKGINKLETEIAEKEDEIKVVEAQIVEVEKQIEAQQKEIEKTQDLLAQRLRAAYMAGETSEIEIFLEAEDFEDFLARSELIRQVSKHDKKIITDLQKQIEDKNKMIEDLEKQKADLEEKKKELRDDKAELVEKKEVVVAKYEAFDAKLKIVESQKAEANRLLAQYEKDEAAAKKKLEEAERAFAEEMDRIAREEAGMGDGSIDNGVISHKFRVSSRGMICPVQDSTAYISSGYNAHMSSSRNGAIDLCAPGTRVINGKTYYNVSRGATLYAVASGTVLKVSYDSRSGNFLMIDHGNGVVTLYAHCESLSVVTGQKVVQGQVVGKLGNTGYCLPAPTAANPSAGAHLHFEVRLNGVRQNPELYMPSPLV